MVEKVPVSVGKIKDKLMAEVSNAKTLSILVPIHNVEDYLAECLDSILTQGLQDYEVLLLNNGSKDDSLAIAQKFAIEWPEVFKVHDLVSKGVSAARNFGIKHAVGDYLLFLDSDDSFDTKAVPLLIKKAVDDDLDIVVGNFYHLLSSGERKANKNHFVEPVCSGEKWLQKCLLKRKFMPAIWNKLYRRQFILQNNIFFVEGIISAEDLLFSTHALIRASQVASVDQYFYIYRHREGSITKRVDLEAAQNRMESHLQVTDRLIKLTQKCTKELKKLILERTVKLNLVSFQGMYQALDNDSEKMQPYFQKINDLKLNRYIRFSRFSHLIDWLTLKLGFERYFSWRQRKW